MSTICPNCFNEIKKHDCGICGKQIVSGHDTGCKCAREDDNHVGCRKVPYDLEPIADAYMFGHAD